MTGKRISSGGISAELCLQGRRKNTGQRERYHSSEISALITLGGRGGTVVFGKSRPSDLLVAVTAVYHRASFHPQLNLTFLRFASRRGGITTVSGSEFQARVSFFNGVNTGRLFSHREVFTFPRRCYRDRKKDTQRERERWSAVSPGRHRYTSTPRAFSRRSGVLSPAGEESFSEGARRRGKEARRLPYRATASRSPILLLHPAEGPGQRTEDISRCRPTYHSFAARRAADTARQQHSQIKERQSPRRAA